MARSSTNIWIDGSQAGATLTELKKSVNLLNREIKDLPRNSDAYKKKMMELREANGALNQHRQQIKGVGDSFGSARNSVASLTGKVLPMVGALGLVSAGVGVVSGAISSWYNNNKQMEKSLSSLQSLTGASTEDLKFYKEQAIEMGKTSTVSAMQTVDAFRLIGSARPDLLKDKEALAQVTKEAIVLSEAAEMELGPSAESLAGFLNQFNLEGKESTRVINALAAGSKEGAAEVSDISLSLEKFGTVANSNNVTVEESIALTETLAEKNIKGAEAGTQLRNVLLNVATASALPKEAQDAMSKYGVDLEIVTNKALPLEQRLREMAKVQGDQNALVKIFGKENVVAGQTILQNVDKFAQLRDAVTGTNVAYEQQAINNDNLDGDLKKLGSAWEGLTLSMDGGSEMFRGVVQVGTDMLNWTSETITAFKEMDSLKIDTQFMKLADALTFGIGPLHEYLEQSIRVNEISIKVIDGIKGETEANITLTESLANNNKALKEGNLTAEERGRLESENEKIISVLNEKYPEFTKNLDLHKISTKDLTKLQKQMNAELINQAVASAKAAEAERLLSVIVENTIKKQTLLNDIKQADKKGFGAGIIKKMFASDDLLEAMNNISDAQKQLNNLGNTFKAVEQTVRGVDLASAFEINSDMIASSSNQLKKAQDLLAKTTDPNKRSQIQAYIDGLNATIKSAKKGNQDALNALLESGNKLDELENNVTENTATNTGKREDVQKKHNEKMKKLYDELGKLIADAEKLRSDFDAEKRLDAIEDAQQKELEALKNSINSKYQAEIESAQKLAKEKGEIGVKAQEQLNSLLVLKEEELNFEKAKINDKYAKEKAEKEYDTQKEANLLWLKQQESFEQSVIDLKVLKAQIGVKEATNKTKAEQDFANQELIDALKAQLDHEKKLKLSALQGEYAENLINKEEFDNRRKELELKYTQDVEEINKTSTDNLNKIREENLALAFESIQTLLGAIQDFYTAQYNKQIKLATKEKNKELAILQEKFDQGIISKEEYETKKRIIDEEFAEKERQVKKERAKKEKAMAIAMAVVQTAQAVMQALASSSPPASYILAALAGVAGAAQIAVISSQPVDQYAEGGYAQVVGKKDGKKYNAKHIGRHPGGMTPSSPSLALISERGPEYFVPNHLLSRPAVANHVAAIEAIRMNQYADGGFTQQASAGTFNSNSATRLESLIAQQSAILQDLNSRLPYLSVNIGDRDLEKMEARNAELKKIVG